MQRRPRANGSVAESGGDAMTNLRNMLKPIMPRSARRIVDPLRRFLDGPGIETYVLRPYHFVPDPEQRSRLTLILPSLSAKEAFGGVTTGLDFIRALARALDCDIRILTEAPFDPADSALPPDPENRISIASLTESGWRLPTRAREMFLAFNWWISINMEAVLAAQAAHFVAPRQPKLYLMQDYEAQFYPFSSAHMYALYACNNQAGPLWGIFNSSEFHDYYNMQGNRCDRAFVFEPRMASRVRALAGDLSAAEKTRKILVYGRPAIDRNCFTILREGLTIWAREHGHGADWEILSAGTKHADIDLGNGQRVRSLGKLTLEGYGQLLRQTSVGISLMSSPHPSYPPLEMAHFGIRTITNNYACKDLTRRHENIVTLPDILPATLAATLQSVLEDFARDPAAGITAQSYMPEYMSDKPFECLEALAAAVARQLGI
jgi:hypothetical protein